MGSLRLHPSLVASPSDTRERVNCALEAIPEVDSIQERIEIIRDHAVVRIFRAAMMLPVMAGRLDPTSVLEKRNQATVSRGTPVSPLVDLIGVDTEEEHERRHPVQPPSEIRGDAKNGAQNDQNRCALEPGMTYEMAGIFVVKNVGGGHQSPGDGIVRLPVRIFEPVKQPRQEVGDKDTRDRLDEH